MEPTTSPFSSLTFSITPEKIFAVKTCSLSKAGVI
ncbi:uncharacterized protein METZ01_LOCUS79007, partial [marine metagenome]